MKNSHEVLRDYHHIEYLFYQQVAFYSSERIIEKCFLIKATPLSERVQAVVRVVLLWIKKTKETSPDYGEHSKL